MEVIQHAILHLQYKLGKDEVNGDVFLLLLLALFVIINFMMLVDFVLNFYC